MGCNSPSQASWSLTKNTSGRTAFHARAKRQREGRHFKRQVLSRICVETIESENCALRKNNLLGVCQAYYRAANLRNF